jgi:hypothetical protein
MLRVSIRTVCRADYIHKQFLFRRKLPCFQRVLRIALRECTFLLRLRFKSKVTLLVMRQGVS